MHAKRRAAIESCFFAALIDGADGAQMSACAASMCGIGRAPSGQGSAWTSRFVPSVIEEILAVAIPSYPVMATDAGENPILASNASRNTDTPVSPFLSTSAPLLRRISPVMSSVETWFGFEGQKRRTMTSVGEINLRS